MLEVNRIDFVLTNKLDDLHGRCGGRGDFLQVVIVHHNIFVFADFVAFDNFGSLDFLVFLRAVPDFFDTRQVFTMQHVKVNGCCASGGKNPHRKRHKSEIQVALPNGSRHFDIRG